MTGTHLRDRRPCIALGLVAALVASACLTVEAGATTEPSQTYFDHIALTDSTIHQSVSRIKVGTLVVFIVHNRSSHPRSIVVGSYRSGLLRPGKQVEFELSFPVPWAFNIRSSGTGIPTVSTKFVCSF